MSDHSKYHDYSKQAGIDQLERMGVDTEPLKHAPEKFADYMNNDKICSDCNKLIPKGEFHAQTFTGNGGRVFRCRPCWDKTSLRKKKE